MRGSCRLALWPTTDPGAEHGKATGVIDDAPLEFPCPECGRNVKTTVGEGRRNRSIRCPGGHTIEVEGSSLDSATQKVEQSVDKVLRRFK